MSDVHINGEHEIDLASRVERLELERLSVLRDQAELVKSDQTILTHVMAVVSRLQLIEKKLDTLLSRIPARFPYKKKRSTKKEK